MARPRLTHALFGVSLLVLAGAAAAVADLSDQFTLGKPTQNPNGTATVKASFPGSGTVALSDARATGLPCSPDPRIKGKTVQIAAGETSLGISPTGKLRRRKLRHHPVTVGVKFTFTPTGGIAATQTVPVTLKIGFVAGDKSTPIAGSASCGPP